MHIELLFSFALSIAHTHTHTFGRRLNLNSLRNKFDKDADRNDWPFTAAYSYLLKIKWFTVLKKNIPINFIYYLLSF